MHLRPLETNLVNLLPEVLDTKLISVREYQGDARRLAELLSVFPESGLESRPLVELTPIDVVQAHREPRLREGLLHV